MTFLEIQTEIKKFLPHVKGAGSDIKEWVNRAMRSVEKMGAWPFLLATSEGTTASSDNSKVIDDINIVDQVIINNKVLQFVPVDTFLKLDPTVADSATPLFWTWIRKEYDTTYSSAVIVKWWPGVNGAYSYKIWRYGFSTELSADTDKNWWTVNAPDVLIYGALVTSSVFAKSDRAGEFVQLYREALKPVMFMSGVTNAEKGNTDTP